MSNEATGNGGSVPWRSVVAACFALIQLLLLATAALLYNSTRDTNEKVDELQRKVSDDRLEIEQALGRIRERLMAVEAKK